MTTAPPYGEEFWNRHCLTIDARDNREFHALMHGYLREAPNWASVERLRNDNEAQIAQLDRATKEDVLGMLSDREKELRANG